MVAVLLLTAGLIGKRHLMLTGWGVYYAIRVFLPLLIRSPKGHIVNVSSVSGFWASRGPRIPLTAYSAAKFAVKGLSEALITDLKVHAPHVRVSVVMPGHVGTPFLINSNRILGKSDVKEMGSTELAVIRKKMSMQDVSIEKMSDSELRNFIHIYAWAIEMKRH